MTNSNEPVAVIGGGRWGTALAQLAAEAGHKTLLWKRDADKADAVNRTRCNRDAWPKRRLHDDVRATADPEEAAAFARFLLVAVPSQVFREVAGTFGGLLGGDHIVVHAVRGLEPETHKRMTEILREETPVRRIGVLAGPHLAAELMEGHPAAAVAASNYPEVVARAQAALVCERFRVYGGRDPVGVEYAGALNNVVAIFAGVAHGLNLGDSTMAMVITRGAAEVRRFGVAMGARAETFHGLAGVGDLMLQCASEHSIERRVGARLAAGEMIEEILQTLKGTAEGVRTARAVSGIARRAGIEMPIVQAVHAILHEGADPAAVRRLLMTRSAKYE